MSKRNTNQKATEVKATEVKATEVKATEVKATEVKATDKHIKAFIYVGKAPNVSVVGMFDNGKVVKGTVPFIVPKFVTGKATAEAYINSAVVSHIEANIKRLETMQNSDSANESMKALSLQVIEQLREYKNKIVVVGYVNDLRKAFFLEYGEATLKKIYNDLKSADLSALSDRDFSKYSSRLDHYINDQIKPLMKSLDEVKNITFNIKASDLQTIILHIKGLELTSKGAINHRKRLAYSDFVSAIRHAYFSQWAYSQEAYRNTEGAYTIQEFNNGLDEFLKGLDSVRVTTDEAVTTIE